MYINDQVITAI